MPVLKYLMTPQNRRRLERRRRSDQSGSPLYPLNLPVVLATEHLDVAVRNQWPAAQKYAPLNWMEVTNNDTVDLMVYIEGQGGDQLYSPASSVRYLSASFTVFRIENLDAAVDTTLGLVVIRCQRKPIDADEAARLEV